MGPAYCSNCITLNLPCASGLADQKGRLCPQAEHACRTYEGEAVWSAVRRAGGWSGGGMVPRRLDRSAIRARLDDFDGWVLEELMDAFEPAALAADAKASERRKADRTAEKPAKRTRRTNRS